MISLQKLFSFFSKKEEWPVKGSLGDLGRRFNLLNLEQIHKAGVEKVIHQREDSDLSILYEPGHGMFATMRAPVTSKEGFRVSILKDGNMDLPVMGLHFSKEDNSAIFVHDRARCQTDGRVLLQAWNDKDKAIRSLARYYLEEKPLPTPPPVI